MVTYRDRETIKTAVAFLVSTYVLSVMANLLIGIDPLPDVRNGRMRIVLGPRNTSLLLVQTHLSSSSVWIGRQELYTCNSRLLAVGDHMRYLSKSLTS